MTNKDPVRKSDRNPDASYAEKLRMLSRQILQFASRGLPRTQFMCRTLKSMAELFHADTISMIVKSLDDPKRYEYAQLSGDAFLYGGWDKHRESRGLAPGEPCAHWWQILNGKTESSPPLFTAKGSLWIRDLYELPPGQRSFRKCNLQTYLEAGDYRSVLVTPFIQEDERIGLLEMKSRNRKFLSGFRIPSVETFVHTLGITVLNQYTQAALQERVKELSCLYRMSQIDDKPFVSLEDLIYRTMELIPPACQYPEVTRSRILLDGMEYSLQGFRDGAGKLSSDIEIDGRKRGKIEVMYTQERPGLDEGPFLKEERELLDVIAKEFAHILKRRESEEDKAMLLNQLHHADRLATVGELAAGVAHEINEPLGSILGFAQLAGKYPEIPGQVRKDLEKIVSASLHAREIVNKMMMYSRQVNPEKKKISINQVIEDSLYFIRSRCIKDGIELQLSLHRELPSIVADPVQLNQVIVNIVVNAIQAMPGGGTLVIRTEPEEKGIQLSIRDTGLGMENEVLQRVFNPFFTTKGAGVGLGLGLSVVDGIIKSHEGKISVKSEPGRGTEFLIHLPLNTPSEETSDGE